jgi:hypothetical protein
MEEYYQKIADKLKNDGKVYILSEALKDKKTFKPILDGLYDCMKQGFEEKEIREYPIHFKFKQGDEFIHTLQVRHFISNLMFWSAHIRLGVVDQLDESFIFDCRKISQDYIKDYIDNKIIIPFRKKVDNIDMNIICHDVIFLLTKIPNDFNRILGMSISLESFMEVMDKNPRYAEIARTKFDENMQPTEIEAELTRLAREAMVILGTEDNLLRPIIRSGTGIKDKQLCEFSISGGLVIQSLYAVMHKCYHFNCWKLLKVFSTNKLVTI